MGVGGRAGGGSVSLDIIVLDLQRDLSGTAVRHGPLVELRTENSADGSLFFASV